MQLALVALVTIAVPAQAQETVVDPLATVNPEDWLWLSCGSGNEGHCDGGILDVQAQAKDKHELRCCSDTKIPGWRKGGGCSNWHQSRLVGLDGTTTCFDSVTYAEGQAICAANHDSTVCTKEQVDNKCAQGSGCGYDRDYIWTSQQAPALELPAPPARNPDDWLWLACGAGKELGWNQGWCDAKFEIKSQANEKHDVRCCSRKERVDWLRNDNCDVWHESDKLIGLDGEKRCIHAVTYADARAICEANDAYVCTKTEVDDGCVQGSGCQHDMDYIWTSDDAPPGEKPGQEDIPEEDYMFLACGTGMAAGGRCSEALSVAKANEEHEVRCCSSTPNNGWMLNSGCQNWHESDLTALDGTPKQCFHSSTYAEAQEICEANDAYVCTREQVMNNCAQGSGCSHDWDMVWTSNKANPADVAAFLARQTQAAAITGVCSAANARVWGDPHFVTFDNLKYDCQGHGEFVIAMSKGSDPLAIHGRFVRRFSSNPKPTVTSSVAIKVLDDVPTIQVSVPDQRVNGVCPFTFTMGNDESPVPDNDIVSFFSNNYNGTVSAYTNGKSIFFTYRDQEARVQVSAGGRGRCVLNTNLCLTPDNHGGAENIVGLLGSPTGNKDDDWVNRDGTTTALPDICDIANPSEEEKKQCKRALNREGHSWCMENWCVGHADNSLWKPETHALYNQCDDTAPDSFFDNLEDPDPAVVEACANTENPEECVTDTVAEILDGGNLDEFVETLVEEEVEAHIVENLSETNAAETLDGWDGPVLSETNAIEIELPQEFEPEDPANFGGGIPPPTPGPSSAPSSTPTVTPFFPDIPDLPDLEDVLGDQFVSEAAGSLGDPHFKTWQGEHFENHGQCDLVLTKDHNFAEGLGLDIQIRTKLVRFWSYIKKAAIRIGNDVLEVEGKSDPEEFDTSYWFNLEYKGEATSIGGFPLTIHDNKVSKSYFEIDLSSKYPGQKIVIATYREFVRVDFQGATAEAFGNTVGMLGDFKTGELLARDGVTSIDEFMEFGNEWQVLPADYMLFHDQSHPQFPKRCIQPEDPQGERKRRLSESTISVEAAEAVCSKTLGNALDIKDCVYDVLATQDLDMVGAF